MKKYSILLIIAFLAFISCGSNQNKIDVAKFETLNRTAENLRMATSIGVNHFEFSKLLRDFATELSLTKDKLNTEKEKEVWDLFAKAFQMYQQSYSLWKDKIQFGGKYATVDDVIKKYWIEGSNEIENARKILNRKS